jgi:sulfotransferase family protein
MEIVKQPLRHLRSAYRRLTGPLRGLPSVLIIGTQKGGTTSLFNYLAEHPDVLPPMGKEVHYFDLHYSAGEHWYRGRFPYASRLRRGALTLDASPYYMMHPLAPARAAGLLPEVKLIALLRNPIDRALSHYQHEVRAGREPLSFEEAIDREEERVEGEEERLLREPGYYSWNHHRYTYARRGLYLTQLLRWMQHYPRAQLLVLQSEWLFRDPPAATDTVYRFIGMRPHQLQRYKTFLQGHYDRSLPERVRVRLANYFAPHNRELFRWLGQEFDWS